MNHNVSVEELRKVVAFRDLPDEHLQWILDRSEYREFEDGELVFKTGDPIDLMWILLEGEISFYMDVNGRLVYYFNFENNELVGGVGGLLPYSRLKKSPGNSYAVGKVRSISLHKSYFPELEQLNPDLIQRLIGYMTERARTFATTQLQMEKVSALGRLSAGIAHELNNPSAAITRFATELGKRLQMNFELTEELLLHSISPELIRSIHTMVQDKNHSEKNKLSALQQVQLEDDINDWLDETGFSENYHIAEAFTEAGFTLRDLQEIYRQVGNKSFIKVLHWLENLLSSERIINDIGEAAWRISLLVGAIKSHVHMDRSNDLHRTNVHKDLDTTLTLLGYKLREKNIFVNKIYCADMPEVEAYISELNQVWMNIIDNAIYAMPMNGELKIETSCNKRNIVIRISDNGTGIPKEIISRIFDPFFTTKKMGEGSGIGLDIVQRVVKQHYGDISVNSVPGKTEFVIHIPVSQKEILVKEAQL